MFDMREDSYKAIDPAEREYRDRIDTVVRQVVEKFGGRFELLSPCGYVLANNIDLFYAVRDSQTGRQLTLRAARALGFKALAVDISRQLDP
jgi:hypothetical protein